MAEKQKDGKGLIPEKGLKLCKSETQTAWDEMKALSESLVTSWSHYPVQGQEYESGIESAEAYPNYKSFGNRVSENSPI